MSEKSKNVLEKKTFCADCGDSIDVKSEPNEDQLVDDGKIKVTSEQVKRMANELMEPTKFKLCRRCWGTMIKRFILRVYYDQLTKISEKETGDPTEYVRRIQLQILKEEQRSDDEESERKRIEKRYGKAWDTKELQEDFVVKSFLAPFVLVKRKSDGKVGHLMFQHWPRFYFSFMED